VRISARCRPLWLLLHGLFHSLMTLFWTFTTMLIVTYVFAIIGLEVIGEGNPWVTSSDAGTYSEYNIISHEAFGSLGRAMLTLLKALTLDSIGGVYCPLIMHRPLLSLYFVGFMLLGSVALMNLVTAIMVDTSIQQAKEDRDTRKALEVEHRRDLVVQLGQMFKDMDSDGSGRLSLKELRHAPPQVMEKLQDIVKMDDALELFETLDSDGNGSLGITEFCEGALKASTGKPMELVCIMKQCHDMLEHIRDMHLELARLASKASSARSPSSEDGELVGI